MPSQQKVEWAKLRTGVVVSISTVITAVLIFLLTGSGTMFEAEVVLRTFMPDSAGMAENAPVRLNGILVGHIKSVGLAGGTDRKRTVEVTMSLPEKYLEQIPEDSKAAISAANLLGDKYINITRGTHAKHVEQNGELASLETQDVPEIIAQSSALLSEFGSILGRVDGLLSVVESGKGNLGKLFKDDTLYDRLNATVAELDGVVKDVHNAKGTVSHLLYDEEFFNQIRSPIQRIDEMLADVQQKKGSAGKFLYDPQLADEATGALKDARGLIAQAQKMVDDLNAGHGTAGKLLKDEEIYNQLDAVAKKVNTAMDRLNAGQGTIGQLMTNPALYDTLNTTTKDLDTVLKNFSANPKKFLAIRMTLF